MTTGRERGREGGCDCNNITAKRRSVKKNTFSGPEGKRRRRRMVREGEGERAGMEGRRERKREVKYWLQIKTRDVDQDKT